MALSGKLQSKDKANTNNPFSAKTKVYVGMEDDSGLLPMAELSKPTTYKDPK